MSKRDLLIKFLWVAGFVLLLSALLTLRFHFQSRNFYQHGEQALVEGNLPFAIAFYDQSIRAHSLLDGPGRLARGRLEEIAMRYEEQGDLQRATQTLQTLLSALSATDTGWSPSRRKMIEELKVKVEKMRRDEAVKSSAP